MVTIPNESRSSYTSSVTLRRLHLVAYTSSLSAWTSRRSSSTKRNRRRVTDEGWRRRSTTKCELPTLPALRSWLRRTSRAPQHFVVHFVLHFVAYTSSTRLVGAYSACAVSRDRTSLEQALSSIENTPLIPEGPKRGALGRGAALAAERIDGAGKRLRLRLRAGGRAVAQRFVAP